MRFGEERRVIRRPHWSPYNALFRGPKKPLIALLANVPGAGNYSNILTNPYLTAHLHMFPHELADRGFVRTDGPARGQDHWGWGGRRNCSIYS